MMTLDFSLENLYRHYYRCRRNKRNTPSALRFEVEQEKNLLDLREALTTRTYQPARSVCFFATRPKLREIFAADFRDRVVHHLLVHHLEQQWEPVFIHDSYACRKGKGVHAGVARLRQFLQQITANGTQRAWYLQLDIHNYFMRINKDVLLAQLEPRLRDPHALWLTRLLVYHDCTRDFVMRGSPQLAARVPPHKTLRGGSAHEGLPIGNLNSQFFANVYLNGLDQFVKHGLRCRYYLRYCDDFILLDRDPEKLRDWRDSIEQYLAANLRLGLNPREQLAPVSDGINFLGYIVRRDYQLVRKRVVHHLRARLKDFESRLVTVRGSSRCYSYARSELDPLRAVLASYLGHLAKADAWRLWAELRREFDFLSRYFTFDEHTYAVRPRYLMPESFSRVRSQFHYLRRQFPDCALLFPVGKFCEFYDGTPAQWVSLLQLTRMRSNCRGARFGFPLRWLPRSRELLLGQGLAVMEIAAQPRVWGGCQARMPFMRYEPSAPAPCVPAAVGVQ